MPTKELLELEHIQQQASRLQHLERIQLDQDAEMQRTGQNLDDISPLDRRKALQRFSNGLYEQRDELTLNRQMMKRQLELVDQIGQQSLSPGDQILFDRLEREQRDQQLFLTEREEEENRQTRSFKKLQEDMGESPYTEDLPGGKLRHSWNYMFGGLSLVESGRGNYFRVTGKGDENPYTGERMPSDKQLKEMILRLVKEEGCDTLYAYKGNHIDPQLTGRMKSMLSRMMRPGHVLEGYDVQVSDNRMPGLESWRGTNFLTRPFAQAVRNYQDGKEERAYQKEERKAIAEENRSPWAPKLPWS